MCNKLVRIQLSQWRVIEFMFPKNRTGLMWRYFHVLVTCAKTRVLLNSDAVENIYDSCCQADLSHRICFAVTVGRLFWSVVDKFCCIINHVRVDVHEFFRGLSFCILIWPRYIHTLWLGCSLKLRRNRLVFGEKSREKSNFIRFFAVGEVMYPSVHITFSNTQWNALKKCLLR